MTKYINFFLWLLMSVFIAACGNEGSGGSDDSAIITEAPITARNSVKIITPDALTKVSLEPLIDVGINGAEIVSVKNKGDGNSKCDLVNKYDLTFEVDLPDNLVCQYEYTVKSIPGENETAMTDEGTIILMGGSAGSILLPEEMTFSIGDKAEDFLLEPSLISDGYALEVGSYSSNPDVAGINDVVARTK